MPSLTIEPVAPELAVALRTVRNHISAAQGELEVIRADERVPETDAHLKLKWALEAANRATYPGLQELWDAVDKKFEEWN